MGTDIEERERCLKLYGPKLVAAYEAFRASPPIWEHHELHRSHVRSQLLALHPECFDECQVEEFRASELMTVLLLQPQLMGRLTDSDLAKLNGYDWMRLVHYRPEFSNEALLKRLADAHNEIWKDADMDWFNAAWEWYAGNNPTFAAYRPEPFSPEDKGIKDEIGFSFPLGYIYSFQGPRIHPRSIEEEKAEIEELRACDPEECWQDIYVADATDDILNVDDLLS